MIIKDKKELERFINNLLVLKNEFVGAYVENNVKYRYVLVDTYHMDIYKTEYDNKYPISMKRTHIPCKRVHERPLYEMFVIPSFTPFIKDMNSEEFFKYISNHPFNKYILNGKDYLSRKRYAIKDNMLIEYSYNMNSDEVRINRVIEFYEDIFFNENDATEIF